MDEVEFDIVDNRTYDSYGVYVELFNSTSPLFITTVYNESEGRNRSHYDVIPKRDPLYILIPITVIYSVILLSGLVGNVSTCVVIARNKHMHTATNYYLFSLAVSDLLLLVSGLPQEMYFIWWRGYPEMLGETVCVIQGFAAETSANATVLTITAFTVERYVAICHPFQSHTFSKLSRAVRLVVVIWLVALGLAVPQAIQFGVLQRKAEDGTDMVLCTVTSEQGQHAFEISTLVFFVAPMTLITVLYALIGLKLRRSKLLNAAKRSSIGSSSAERGNDRATLGKNGTPQNYVIRMLVAVVVAFFICWAPFHAQRLLAVYALRNNSDSPVLLTVYKTLTYTSGVLYYMSTTVNPVLYHIMSHKFREAFKSTLAQPCGYDRKTSNKRRTYTVLQCQQSSRHMSLQQHQQQIQLEQQRRTNKTGDKSPSTLPRTESQSTTKHSVQQMPQNCCKEELKPNPIQCKPTELSMDNLQCSSYPMYSYRPRGFSNSSQTTLTTSLGKLSLNEGNNFCRFESNAAATDDTKTSKGECGEHSKFGLVIRTCVTGRTTDNKSNITSHGRLKQHCFEPHNCKGLVKTTSKFKSAPRSATIGELAKKFRSLPLAGNTKRIFTPQHKAEQDRGNEDIREASLNRVSSHVTIDSAKSTISNSSLKDLDGAEFIDSELAHYMGELNEQRLLNCNVVCTRVPDTWSNL